MNHKDNEHGENAVYDMMEDYDYHVNTAARPEFPVVVMTVTMKHIVMLQCNLIYTGITCAKKICVFVGTTETIAYAIKQNTVSKRDTKLKERG